MEKDSHLLELCRYVVLNPVRAGMVAKPGEWKWSSYERRKIRAALFGVIGVLCGAAAYIAYVVLGEKTHELVSSISSVLVEGQTIDATDINLVEANNELSYVMGLRVGQILHMLVSTSGISFGYCLYLLFWPRKERLIKELYEKGKYFPKGVGPR